MQEFKNSDFFGMITDRAAVQAPDLMGRVTMEAIPVQVFTVIKADMVIKAIRATKVVIIIRGVSSSSNRVTRAIRSSSIVGSIMSSPLAYASAIRNFIKGQ